MSDREDSLFDANKGDSLGDGTWGRRTTDEPKLAPVDWSALQGSEVQKKPVRTRLATPAPGSQKGSGLLDIRALAAEMQRDKVEPAAPPKPQPAAEVKGAARLATAAKASHGGSGLINVADIVRQQEEEQAKASASSSAEAGIEDSQVSPMSAAASSSFASLVDGPAASQSADVPDALPAGHRPMLMAVLGLLTVVVAGLAIYVLTGS